MSQADVRAAVVAYLLAQSEGQGNGTIPFLNEVYGFPPKITPEGEFFVDPGISSGALIFVYFRNHTERRIAVGEYTPGSPHGRKEITYNLVLNCFFRSTKPDTQDVGVDNETFQDALVTAIRADRNAGAPGTVFSWGEGSTNGGPDVEVDTYYPQPLNAKWSVSQVYSQVRLKVLQILDT